MKRRKPAAVDAASREVLKKLRVIFSSIKAHFRRIEAACGIGGSHVWVLSEIGKSPGLRVSDLAEALLIHQSTASNLLEKLESMGLVMKERSSSDRRVVYLKLSAEGRRVLARAPTRSIGLVLDGLRRLPPSTLKSLSDDLGQLIAEMEHPDVGASSRTLADL